MIVYIRDYLRPKLMPRYIPSIEERVYVEGPNRQVVPDVALRRGRSQAREAMALLEDADGAILVQVPALDVHETYIAILDRQSSQRIVTVIELLSPTNKYAGPGRESYRAKQQEVLQSDAHLVEIDLLRYGPHVLAVPEWAARGRGPYDYLVCVNRAGFTRDEYALYPRRLPEKLPRVLVPLAGDDAGVVLDTQAVIAQVYEAGSYAERLAYDAPCVPPLPPADQEWADSLSRAARAAAPQES